MFIICIVAAAAAGLRGASRVRAVGARATPAFGLSPRARPHDSPSTARSGSAHGIMFYVTVGRFRI